MSNNADNDVDNIEDDLRATLENLRAGGDGAVEPEQPAVETPEANAQPEPKADKNGNLHGEKGRFTAKSKADVPVEATDNVLGTPGPAKELADKEAAAAGAKVLQPPSHWTPEAKAAFVNAPRPLQEQALKREEEISNAAKDWQGKAEDYNRLNRVIAPNADRWARQGRSPDAAINQLISFERALESNPAAATFEVLRVFAPGNELQVINQIAQANGYQLVRAGNQGETAQGAQPAMVDPTVRSLQEQVHNLTTHLTQQQQAEVNNNRRQLLSEVNAFAAEPEHLYFENVRKTVAMIVTEGDENGDTRPIRVRLQEAYDQAVWADPKTRALMLQQQQRQAQVEEAKRVEAARRAGGSITGSPEQGAFVPGNNRRSQRDSIEDDVRAAALELQGR